MDRPNIRQNNTTLKLVFKFMDAVAIGSGLILLLQWFPELDSKATVASYLIALGIFSLAAELFGLYRNWQGIQFVREATCGVMTWGVTLVCLFALGGISQYTTEFCGKALIVWFAFTPVISLSFRIWYRRIVAYMVKHEVCSRKFAVVGVNPLGLQLVQNINSSPELGLKFLGFYDDRPEDRTVDLPADTHHRLGQINDLIEHAKRREVNVVFITLPMRAEARIRKVIEGLSDSTTSVYIVPDLFVFQMLHSRWSDIQGLPVVSVFENPFYGVDGLLKRSVDMTLAMAALLVAALPMAAIAVAVKLTSRGPVFFRQRRYGLDGREIRVLKFRSMTVCEDGDTVAQARKDDNRLTSIGGFLRSSSLDELPQLFNVLAGSMSLIGPRPHAAAHNEYYRSQIDGYMLRHKVKPGITGLAQVNGCRGETETVEKMAERIRFDHQYIREWSIWLDLKILFRTCSVVFSRQNAY
jgi:putative colanic acid biosynthesis UDP-glucose lipid carrier transferase